VDYLEAPGLTFPRAQCSFQTWNEAAITARQALYQIGTPPGHRRSRNTQESRSLRHSGRIAINGSIRDA
jgi:hypothetical protein